LKTAIRIAVVLSVIVFTIGAFAAWRGWIDANTYIVISGIAGSLASVLGLVALSTPRLTTKDVREVEADLVACTRFG
jgi:hypothetical protein